MRKCQLRQLNIYLLNKVENIFSNYLLLYETSYCSNHFPDIHNFVGYGKKTTPHKIGNLSRENYAK